MRSIKFFIGYAIAIFLIVVVITVNAVCSIAQFEVTVTGSSYGEALAAEIQATLDEEFGGKSYLFFRESSVYDVVSDAGEGYLEVESVQKHFPNKITVSLSEKYEVFAFLNETDGRYYVVGDDRTVLAVKEDNANNIDGTNIVITGIGFEAQAAGETSVVGETFAVFPEFEDEYESLWTLFEQFSGQGMWHNIVSIDYDDTGLNDPTYDFNYFYIDTVEGVHVWLENPGSRMEEKAKLALQTYEGLTEAQRTFGYINVIEVGYPQPTGELSASYSTDEPPLSAENK